MGTETQLIPKREEKRRGGKKNWDVDVKIAGGKPPQQCTKLVRELSCNVMGSYVITIKRFSKQNYTKTKGTRTRVKLVAF